MTALEAAFYPSIVGRLSGSEFPGVAEYERWRSAGGRAEATLDWLGVDADWLERHAVDLVRSADFDDPLRDWLHLVASMSPRRWDELKGPAKLAIERRTAAEVFYDASADARGENVRAQIARTEPGRFRARRLHAADNIDPVLTEFGVSPHPSLLLVVEGPTEMLAFPQAMELLQISQRPNFIQLVNRQGVGQSLTSLIDHAIVPRLQEAERDGRFPMSRPFTRMMVVTDPEGKTLLTPEAREKTLRGWKRQVLEALPDLDAWSSVQASLIDDLIRIETWDPQGNSFEFAHFTDAQIAAAIASLDRRQRQPPMDTRIAAIAATRDRRGGLTKDLNDA